MEPRPINVSQCHERIRAVGLRNVSVVQGTLEEFEALLARERERADNERGADAQAGAGADKRLHNLMAALSSASTEARPGGPAGGGPAEEAALLHYLQGLKAQGRDNDNALKDATVWVSTHAGCSPHYAHTEDACARVLRQLELDICSSQLTKSEGGGEESVSQRGVASFSSPFGHAFRCSSFTLGISLHSCGALTDASLGNQATSIRSNKQQVQ